ncbi:hypothetical protein BKA83DRAFT_3136090 [Pisolithus microcarpus]|nr:hypothetical protein BKA83DRAFT_3136090 [Pisolithus microcarpus]
MSTNRAQGQAYKKCEALIPNWPSSIVWESRQRIARAFSQCAFSLVARSAICSDTSASRNVFPQRVEFLTRLTTDMHLRRNEAVVQRYISCRRFNGLSLNRVTWYMCSPLIGLLRRPISTEHVLSRSELTSSFQARLDGKPMWPTFHIQTAVDRYRTSQSTRLLVHSAAIDSHISHSLTSRCPCAQDAGCMYVGRGAVELETSIRAQLERSGLNVLLASDNERV